MGTRWDRKKKLVVTEMTWEEARDFGYWLIAQGDRYGEDLVEAAKEGAGFVD